MKSKLSLLKKGRNASPRLIEEAHVDEAGVDEVGVVSAQRLEVRAALDMEGGGIGTTGDE